MVWQECQTQPGDTLHLLVCYCTQGRLHFCGCLCGSSKLSSVPGLLCVASLKRLHFPGTHPSISSLMRE